MTFKTKRRGAKPRQMQITPMALMRAKSPRGEAAKVKPPRFLPPEIPPGVVSPEDKLAMDNMCIQAGVYEYANMCTTREAFLGYANLAQLTQKPEFRLLSEKTANAMVRKWIEFKSTGKDDKTKQIKALEQLLKKYKIRELFRECAKQDGFFGRCQLFVDLGEHTGEELQTPMLMHPVKLAGKLRKFKLVEAMYSYPVEYRADNPLADSYYNPQAWMVMGQKVHASRLLLFISKPLPDILKPAYNFGGMSMSQLALPYVENWLGTRQSVGQLLRNFSINGIKTNLAAVLAGDTGDDVLSRAELYNAMRDNQGLFVLDKDQEEFFQHNTPLTTLDKLQAQSQEHMSSISSMPLIVAFGITPTGLNASSEGELRVWYDFIADMQEVLFREQLQKVIEIIQIAEWGAVDPEITFDFRSLWEPNAVEVEQARYQRAQTDQIYFDMGSVSQTEVRNELAHNPDSGYNGLAEMPPELPEPQDDEETTGTGEIDNPQADTP